ncbi:MAG: hypothetical protein AAGI10_06695 [Pseudomonadota bacterium]
MIEGEIEFTIGATQGFMDPVTVIRSRPALNMARSSRVEPALSTFSKKQIDIPSRYKVLDSQTACKEERFVSVLMVADASFKLPLDGNFQEGGLVR